MSFRCPEPHSDSERNSLARVLSVRLGWQGRRCSWPRREEERWRHNRLPDKSEKSRAAHNLPNCDLKSSCLGRVHIRGIIHCPELANFQSVRSAHPVPLWCVCQRNKTVSRRVSTEVEGVDTEALHGNSINQEVVYSRVNIPCIKICNLDTDDFIWANSCSVTTSAWA